MKPSENGDGIQQDVNMDEQENVVSLDLVNQEDNKTKSLGNESYMDKVMKQRGSPNIDDKYIVLLAMPNKNARHSKQVQIH
ncbi:uncharacterized protein G2W53_003912 [Senna tora]|uniref:Uncharacterized protein n=1 Tax=Senna tora TaxID=362788 RepID=A0A834XAZ0_9FABA|nr:uncharacterized protein G2W53_003912 [Senna tora]